MLQGVVRTLRLDFERQAGFQLAGGDALVRWLFRHAAWSLQRFQPIKGWPTAFFRNHGSTYTGKTPEFGEKCLALDPTAW